MGHKSCLVCENHENAYSACGSRGKGKQMLLDCWRLTCDRSLSVMQPDLHNACRVGAYTAVHVS